MTARALQLAVILAVCGVALAVVAQPSGPADGGRDPGPAPTTLAPGGVDGPRAGAPPPASPAEGERPPADAGPAPTTLAPGGVDGPTAGAPPPATSAPPQATPASPPAGERPPADRLPAAESEAVEEPERGAAQAGDAIRIIIALVAILVLAYVAGDPRVHAIERRLRVSGVVTSGLPFVFIGVLLGHPDIGVLSESVLHQIRPFLPFGLGWIGFVIGIRFDLQRVVRLPRLTGVSALITGLVPLATITGAAAIMLLITDGFTTEGVFLRNALILGVAGLLGVRAARVRALGVEVDRLARLAQLQELIAIACLLVLAAFFRPAGAVGWQMPPIAWLFVTVGLGTLLGGVIYVILSQFDKGPEVSLLMLGSIALAAGVASYLRLSPIAVCFIAAAMVGNFPGGWKELGAGALVRLERPIYLVFLVIVGAIWQIGAWQGWVLMALFVVARFGGRWLGVELVRRRFPGELTGEDRSRLVLAPVDALAVAIVVNAQDLYLGTMIPWLVTAVIGGAIVTEVIVQMAGRGEEPVEARVSHIAQVARARAPSLMAAGSEAAPDAAGTERAPPPDPETPADEAAAPPTDYWPGDDEPDEEGR
jgi:hypothetical protein